MERVNPYLNNFAYCLVLVFAFVLIISNVAAEILLGLIFLIWVAQTLAYRRKSFMDYPLFGPICALVVYRLLVLLVSGHGGRLGAAIEQLVLPLGYFAFGAIVVNEERRRKVLWLLVAGAVVASGYGITKYWLGLEDRISSFASGYTTLAVYLTATLAIAITALSHAPKPAEKIFWSMVSVPLLAGLLLTYKRACYLVVLLYILLLGVLKDRRVLVLPLLVITLSVAASQRVQRFLWQRLDPENSYFLSDRDVLLRKGLEKAENLGFFGYGINSMPLVVDVDNDPVIQDHKIRSWHNLYLELLLDGGPLHLVIFVWLVVAQARFSLGRLRRAHDAQQQTYQLAALLFLLGIVLIGFLDNPLRSPITAMLTWMLLGLSVI